jgi:hypothetical protein
VQHACCAYCTSATSAHVTCWLRMHLLQTCHHQEQQNLKQDGASRCCSLELACPAYHGAAMLTLSCTHVKQATRVFPAAVFKQVQLGYCCRADVCRCVLDYASPLQHHSRQKNYTLRSHFAGPQQACERAWVLVRVCCLELLCVCDRQLHASHTAVLGPPTDLPTCQQEGLSSGQNGAHSSLSRTAQYHLHMAV